MFKRLFLFLFLNFAALGIGGLFTSEGVPSQWYQTLNQSPWTPPGWMFGTAWTIIMICFAFFMAYAITSKETRVKLIWVYAIQWFLNILWNPVFFYFHEVLAGMIIISALTILIAYMFITFQKSQRLVTLFILPYVIWLVIATSLNGYILFYN